MSGLPASILGADNLIEVFSCAEDRKGVANDKININENIKRIRSPFA